MIECDEIIEELKVVENELRQASDSLLVLQGLSLNYSHQLGTKNRPSIDSIASASSIDTDLVEQLVNKQLMY
jgi:hypothetical protein